MSEPLSWQELAVSLLTLICFTLLINEHTVTKYVTEKDHLNEAVATKCYVDFASNLWQNKIDFEHISSFNINRLTSIWSHTAYILSLKSNFWPWKHFRKHRLSPELWSSDCSYFLICQECRLLLWSIFFNWLTTDDFLSGFRLELITQYVGSYQWFYALMQYLPTAVPGV